MDRPCVRVNTVQCRLQWQPKSEVWDQATIEVKMTFFVCYYQIIMFLHITLSSQLSDSRIVYKNNLIWARNIFKSRVVSLLTFLEKLHTSSPLDCISACTRVNTALAVVHYTPCLPRMEALIANYNNKGGLFY